MKQTIQTLAMAILFAVSVGCQDKKEGGTVVATPGGINPTCTNCPTNVVNFLGTANGRTANVSNPDVELSLEFRTDQPVSQQQMGYFTGKVTAQGVLRVFRAQGSMCPLPAGEYAVSTVNVGDIQGWVFGNLVLQSTSGPAQVRIAFNVAALDAVMPPRIDQAGSTFPLRILGEASYLNLSSGNCQGQGWYQPANLLGFL